LRNQSHTLYINNIQSHRQTATSSGLGDGGVLVDDACCHHYTILLLQDPYLISYIQCKW